MTTTSPPATAERRQFNCKITGTAYDSWLTFTRDHGITMVSLVEALGPKLEGLVDPEVITQAREIDHKRRHRL